MKKLLLFVGLVSITAVSCNKGVTTSNQTLTTSPTTKTAITPVDQPTSNFSITFDGQGGYTTSDANYVNSFPQLHSAVSTMATSIQGQSVIVSVNDQGEVSSANSNYDGLQFMTLMTKFGNFYYAGTQDLKVVYGKEGFKSISNPDLLVMFPSFKQRLIENGEILKDKITDGKDIIISFTANNELMINGIVINTNAEDLYEFKMCMRYYWWMPSSLAYAVCAIALVDM